MVSTPDMRLTRLFPGRSLWPTLALVGAVFVAYANVFANGFLFDDGSLIVNNEYLRSWDGLRHIFVTPIMAGGHTSSDFYRPLQILAYFFIYQAAGPWVLAFHLLNVTLHAVNTCFVWALARKLSFRENASFVGALIWAVHPVHTEAVSYMSGTADLLYSFFCLLALIIAVPSFTRRTIWLAALCGVCALMSKETAVVLPLLAMACLYACSPDRSSYKSYLATWPLWLVVTLYMALRFIFFSFNCQEFVGTAPDMHIYASHIGVRLLTFLATLPAYGQILLWPADLHMERSFPIPTTFLDAQVLIGVSMFFASLVICVRNRKSVIAPAASWGLLWFGVSYAPQSGILIVMNSLFLEHWMYLPTVGLAVGGAQTLYQHVHQVWVRRVVTTGACFLALCLCFKTTLQNVVWHDPIIFYENIINHGEPSVRAYNNLGLAYLDRNEFDAALIAFQRALSIKEMAETHGNIAAAYSRMPNRGALVPEAIAELKRAVTLDPNYVQGYLNLEILYSFLGQDQRASYYHQKAAEARSTYAHE